LNSNSSTTLPDGSSTRIARPAPPSLISPRNFAPAARLTAAARARGAQIQGQVVAQQRRELAGIVLVDREIEIVPIESERRVDVGDDVSDGCRSTFSCRARRPRCLVRC
jgi:hypothetical protein